MRSKITLIGILGLILSLAMPASAWAQEDLPNEPARLAGEILSIQGPLLTVESWHQGDLQVHISEDTKFRSLGGEVQSVDDLAVGMKVVVLGTKEGELVIARIVAVADRPDLDNFHRFRGEVISIDHLSGSFTLEHREGEQKSFLTSEDTKYHSRGDQLQSFADLQNGQRLAVVSRSDEEGSLALRILLLADDEFERPRREVRARGKVSLISQNRLVVENRQGERAAFILTEQTKIKRVGAEGLQVGDQVVVAGYENEQGMNVAVLVLARHSPNRELREGALPESRRELLPSSEAPFASWLKSR